MKLKKIFMIFVLIAFVAVIGVVLMRVNNTAVEKTSGDTKVADETETLSSSGNVRKSSGEVTVDTSNMIEITDNYFIEATNDVYLNLEDYIGKTIKMEGLIYSYEDSNGETCYAVVRNTPGCCGSDGLAGLDIRYDKEYPAEDTWVEVIGVVGTDTMYGSEIPAIQVSTLTQKEEGQTFVTN